MELKPTPLMLRSGAAPFVALKLFNSLALRRISKHGPHTEPLADTSRKRCQRTCAFDALVETGWAMIDGAFLYILECADASYYVGTARSSLEQRVAEHNAGTFGGYTAQRRPVTLVFSQWFDHITEAIAAERQVKGWSRAKKEALIRGDFARVPELSKRRRQHGASEGP